MKKRNARIWLIVAITAVSFLMVQCSKSEASQSTDNYNYVSPAEKSLLLEEQNPDNDIIIACIYDCINSMPVEEISDSELAAVTYMREEELLAHDVYVALYELYPVPVFNNISKSETIHTVAMLALLEKYALPDPAANHQQGVFEEPVLQALYDTLTAMGSASFQDALMVGATIEDLDIDDLMVDLAQHVDNTDFTYAFQQLLRGSRNHLRAFHAHLTFQGLIYTPQYISQELYDQITSSSWQVGNGFCVCSFPSKDNSGKMSEE